METLNGTFVISRELTGILLLHGAIVALGGWIASPEPAWIAIASVAGAGALLALRGRGRSGALAGVILLAAVASAFVAQQQLNRLAEGWPVKALAWEAEVQSALSVSLERLLEAGEESAARLAREWNGETGESGTRQADALVREGVDALAIFGPGGSLVVWAGTHQGPIPEEARSGASRYLYREGALFAYLYVTEPLPGGAGTVVAVSLLRAALPPPLEAQPLAFADRFARDTGAEVLISRFDRVIGESIWDLRWEDEILFSVSVAPASEGEARSRLALAWARWILLLLGIGWVLAVSAGRGAPASAAAGGVGLLALIAVLPLGRLFAGERVFSPADFLLPGPADLTLGHLLAITAAATLILGLLPLHTVSRGPRWVVSGLATLLGVGCLWILGQGAAPGFTAGGEPGWVLFQGVGAGLALIPMAVASAVGRSGSGSRLRPSSLAGALAIGGVLGLAFALMARAGPGAPLMLGLLWGVPLWIAIRALPGGQGWGEGMLRWSAMAVLATTLALPWAWGERIEARVASAEERIDRLGTRPDPFLEFLLLRAGERAQQLSEMGLDPVEVLYGAWSGSDLAREGVPLWITLWSAEGEPQDELRIGVTDPRPLVPIGFLEDTRAEDEIALRRFDLADTHYMVAAPLAQGSILSIVVPPRRLLPGESPLGPLFGPARGDPDPLALIPLLPGEVPGETEGVRWFPSPNGWQGEVFLVYPDEVYHAHYALELPGLLLLLARGTLLLFLNLAAVTLFWVVGRWLGEGRPGRVQGVLGALGSFRGRLTLALFGFFLLPSILFGTLAYRTLAGASIRTAEVLARRAVEDASSWYVDAGGAMDLLATRVGSDLLLFEGGELVSGSSRELLALGLYEGWLPPGVHRDMERGEALTTTSTAALGGWQYVVAYRRVAGGSVLAAPAPLQAGATAIRQRDVADLIGFAVVLGGAFSILLSLLVGRALSRPIQTLQIASERVGAGNMGVHLPEDRSDEFGAVFNAFNRMVDRLARTRRALLRSSRRTRAIVEEVATGVLALDPQGRVTLANPRAGGLLGVEFSDHRPLGEYVSEDPTFAALVSWVERYFRDGLRQGGTELVAGDRRIRVRARRISRRGPLGGAVLTLEDVTDELRSERILAWGEMAQQVAHEVKNPLTPIQLGVQHIRRAWDDRRPDFEAILNRNVEAILREIDRLAAIATSFSRFAAPTPAGVEPLERVVARDVVADVLDLYQAGEGAVTFSLHAEEPLVPVSAREGELKEVLVNLLENARNALPEGGLVRVELAPLNEDRAVELRVRDDGPGIPPEMLARIFEPHFSTRSGGTGLGLAIVRRLVESWGGRVWAESNPGKGTILRVHLPEWGGSPVGGTGGERFTD